MVSVQLEPGRGLVRPGCRAQRPAGRLQHGVCLCGSRYEALNGQAWLLIPKRSWQAVLSSMGACARWSGHCSQQV